LAQQGKNVKTKVKAVTLFLCLLSCTALFSNINVQDSAVSA
jgi:hypothetical protein